MHIAGNLGAWILRMFHFIFKKLGINGILVMILLIELPALYAYYCDERGHYVIERNYRMQGVVNYREVSVDELPEKEKTYASGSGRYFYTDVQIDNYYYKELLAHGVNAESSEGYALPFYQCDYYDDLESLSGKLRSVIPAGTSAYVTYLLTIPDYHMDTIDSVTIYSVEDHYLNYDSEEEEYEAGRRITVPLSDMDL